jgi:hypothetical protein
VCEEQAGSQSLIEWTAHAEAAAIEDMGIDHRRFDIRVAEQFLHGADVIARFLQARGETVTEGVTASASGRKVIFHFPFDICQLSSQRCDSLTKDQYPLRKGKSSLAVAGSFK